jgi:DNA/RNA-binding domain of Phe-tRNA-synthetase-like protein
MGKFVIDASFWEVFPDAEIGVVLAMGIDNTRDGTADVRAEIRALLEQSQQDAQQYVTAAVWSENPVIAVWREAYRQFRTKKGARASIEALLKRVDTGKGIGSINPLVDIYNAVSLRYGLPCGGEDMETFQGNLRLTVTPGHDPFIAIGDDADDPTLPGEICYLDDRGAVCRCLNWRDGQRTMLTERTTNAFLVMESMDPERSAPLRDALGMLSRWTQKLGGTTRIDILNKNHGEVVLGGW